MDRLDKLSILIIIVLVSSAAILLAYHARHPADDKIAAQSAEPVRVRFSNPEYDKKITIAKKLVIGGNLEKAEQLLKELAAANPYEGMPYMLMADMYMRKQQPLSAMMEYRKAIDLNPDFLDKKTEVFQGKKIKVNLEEVKEILDKGTHKNMDKAKLKEYQATLYYMLRRLAGSCG